MTRKSARHLGAMLLQNTGILMTSTSVVSCRDKILEPSPNNLYQKENTSNTVSHNVPYILAEQSFAYLF